MTREQFVSFLVSRGFGEEALHGLEKGREDITILSGPHLGGFNQTISLPEMIEAIGAVAAMCIFGRYRAAQNRPVVP